MWRKGLRVNAGNLVSCHIKMSSEWWENSDKTRQLIYYVLGKNTGKMSEEYSASYVPFKSDNFFA